MKKVIVLITAISIILLTSACGKTENIEKYMDDVFKCAILSSARKRRELPDAKL